LINGADINAQGGECGYANVLEAASYQGNMDVVRLLLESSADVDYGCPLQAASKGGGHIDVACLLLESGADVNAQGGEFGSALQATSWHGATEIVLLLLENGADVHTQGGDYGSVLQAASR
ncbi:ankyrin repeat-containing domain protein, partial [Mycena galericulata]